MDLEERKSKALFQDDQIDLLELFNALWKSKILISSIVFLFSMVALIYSLNLPNIYNAKTLLKPTESSQGIESAARRYGGLATLAGINLPSANATNSETAIERLKSFQFFSDSFLTRIQLEDLFAIQAWDPVSKLITYDDDIFIHESNTWIRKVKKPFSVIPSAQEAHKLFLDRFLSISVNKETSFITLSIEHQSPDLAKEWLDIIIQQINIVFREDQKQKTLNSIDFISQQISRTNYSEVKQALAEVLQQETEKLMLIEVNKDYVFQAIDPPYAPEIKSKPKRSVICVLGALMGGLLGSFIALIRYFFYRK